MTILILYTNSVQIHIHGSIFTYNRWHHSVIVYGLFFQLKLTTRSHYITLYYCSLTVKHFKLDGSFRNAEEVEWRVCLVALSTSVTSGVWSCPQHPGRGIILTGSWVPPVPHSNDLSPSKLWPLVACGRGRKGKWANEMSLKAFDSLRVADCYIINPEHYAKVFWNMGLWSWSQLASGKRQ